ncbi:MAG: arginase family protein, partial [Dongiaceae bacterium]
YRFDRRVAKILHGDVPTFMEAAHHADTKSPDVVVVGVPYEGVKIRDRFTFVPATANLQAAIYARTGADKAPDAIRRNSVYYSLDHSGGLMPERGIGFRIADHLQVCDGGNCVIDHTVAAEETLHAAADRITGLIGRSAIPIVLGGDDTVPYVGMRAVARQRKRKFSVIKLDSHYDLSWEPRYWAGSQWARCMEAGYLQPENFALIGIRGLRNAIMWHEIATELGVRVWTMQDVEEKGIAACVREALAAVAPATDALYLSLDLDVIDPAFLPAQKYPDPAGLTAREALRALRIACDEGPPIAGFDMACLGPDFDVNGLGSQLAARCAVEVIGGVAWRKA